MVHCINLSQLTLRSSTPTLTYTDVTLGVYAARLGSLLTVEILMVTKNQTAEVNVLKAHVLLGNEGPLQSQTLMFKAYTLTVVRNVSTEARNRGDFLHVT